jgi:ATP-binding cassette subfamily B protein
MNNPLVRLLRSLWHYGAAQRVGIIGYYCLFIMAEIAAGLTPYFFGLGFNALQVSSSTMLYDSLFWLGMVILCYWASSLFQLPGLILEQLIAFKIKEHFLITAYTDLTHLPLAWHHSNHSGSVVTSVNRASLALYDFASRQNMYFQSIVRLLISVVFLLWVSIPLGVVAIVLPIIIAVSVFWFDNKLIALYELKNKLENRAGAVLLEYLSNITTILTLRLGNFSRMSLVKHFGLAWKPYREVVVLREIRQRIFGTLLTTVLFSLLMGYVVYSIATTGMVMLGVFIMIGRYQSEMNGVFWQLGGFYNDIVRMGSDVESMNEVFANIARHTQVSDELAMQAPVWQALTVSHLAFSHADTLRGPALADVSLTLMRGQKVALIGASGAGKSTLLNILSGLYTAQSGSLTIDGVLYDSFMPLSRMTTLVPQDPELFDNSIEFNVTFDAPAKRSDIELAVHRAGFADILATLPEGLETNIKEKGLNLSVGQKQRLALARGLFAARNSSIVLMDEPTSSVDLGTEKQILTGMFSALPEVTCIVSLHRLHLLPHFDVVILLQEGRVIAAGPVAQLLETPGPVQDMWRAY